MRLALGHKLSWRVEFSRLFHTAHVQNRQDDSLRVPSTKIFLFKLFSKIWIAIKPQLMDN